MLNKLRDVMGLDSRNNRTNPEGKYRDTKKYLKKTGNTAAAGAIVILAVGAAVNAVIDFASPTPDRQERNRDEQRGRPFRNRDNRGDNLKQQGRRHEK